MNEMNRQLIVMGNGFDLECGLKTKYQDFFDYRFGISLEKQIIKRINPKADEKEVTENFDQLVKAKIRKYCTKNFAPIVKLT
ncbi:AbiH family protein [Lactobacillus crispatus]|uniref:AbiH family protein n=1 Tax=Lactobacillus crispatus TaxID=47770 RepID=UPI0030FCD00E